MPNRFDIKSCPLCQSHLQVQYASRDGYQPLSYERKYYCPVTIQYESPAWDSGLVAGANIILDGYFGSTKAYASHYEVTFSSTNGTRQTVILEPYMLVTMLHEPNTNVYKFPNSPMSPDKFHIMKLPTLTFEDPEHLVKRLKTWTVFS